MEPAPRVSEVLRDQRLFLSVAVAVGASLVLVPGWGGSVATWSAMAALWLVGTPWAAWRSRRDARTWLIARVGIQNAGIQLLVALPGMAAGTLRAARASEGPWPAAFVSNALVTLVALPAFTAVVFTCLALVPAVPLHDLLRRRAGAALLGVVALAAGLAPVNAITAEGRTGASTCAADATVELDHVPVAVPDLERAGRLFRSLGFALKPGRHHDNGLRNLHAKFRDGREIELITADRAGDDLAARYRGWLTEGPGPVFLALHAGPAASVAARLEAESRGMRVSGALVSFVPGHRWEHLFFWQLSASPTDRPEHFEHTNGAETLEAVWIVGDAAAERELVEAFGARECPEPTHLVDGREATSVALRDSGLLVLPGEPVHPGRPLVGMTVRVADLRAAGSLVRSAGLEGTTGTVADRSSLLLDLREELGMWLELRAR